MTTKAYASALPAKQPRTSTYSGFETREEDDVVGRFVRADVAAGHAVAIAILRTNLKARIARFTQTVQTDAVDHGTAAEAQYANFAGPLVDGDDSR